MQCNFKHEKLPILAKNIRFQEKGINLYLCSGWAGQVLHKTLYIQINNVINLQRAVVYTRGSLGRAQPEKL